MPSLKQVADELLDTPAKRLKFAAEIERNLEPRLRGQKPVDQSVTIRTALPGFGKTHDALIALVRQCETYLVASPTLVKMVESHSHLTSANSPAKAYFGLQAKDLQNPVDDMCAYRTSLELLARAGGKPSDACKGCPLLETCPRGQTIMSKEPIGQAAISHAMLYRPAPSPLHPDGLIPKTPEHLVIDEDPLPALQLQELFDTDLMAKAGRILRGELKGVHRKSFDQLRTEIERAAGDDRRLHYRNIPSLVNLDGLRQALLFELAAPFGAAANREPEPDKLRRLKDRVAQNAPLLSLRKLISIIISNIRGRNKEDGHAVPGILVREERIHTAFLPELHYKPRNPPVILTATPSDPILYHRFWEDTEFDSLQELERLPDETEADWKTRVYGNTEYVAVPAVVTNASMTPGGETFEQVVEFIEARAEEVPEGQRLLLVCTIAIGELLKEHLPEIVDVENFEAVKGVNTFADGETISHPVQIVLGRPEPPVMQLQLIAEVYAGRTIEVDKYSQWDRTMIHRTARDGTTVTLQRPHHADPFLDALLRQVTYSAVTQADRSRSFRRQPGQATVYFVGQIPAAQGYDRAMPLDGAGVLGANTGVVPEPGQRTTYAAFALLKGWGLDKNAIRRARRRHPEIDKDLARFAGWTRMFIKVPGQRYKYGVLVHGPDPKAKVLAHPHLPEGATVHYRRERNAA
ncbi:MAG: hypothetical protein AAGK37_21920 [Pseudomonadota bacterium]